MSATLRTLDNAERALDHAEVELRRLRAIERAAQALADVLPSEVALGSYYATPQLTALRDALRKE